MPYDVTDSFKQEELTLEQDRLVDCYIIDLASVMGYVSFDATTKQITSRDRDGIFPGTRIKTGDVIEITGTTYNNSNVTVVSVTDRVLTVSESITTESVVEATFTNYQYYVKNDANVYGFKMQGGSIINSNQIYTAINIKREDLITVLEGARNPRIKLTVANVDRIMESLIQNRAYLRGCYIYQIAAYAKHFPTGSGYLYIGTSSDYLSLILERFEIDSTSSGESVVEFACRYKFFAKDIKIPRRLLDATFCQWAERYGGTECDPTTAIDFDSFPTCNGTLTHCRERNNSVRFGGFPGIPKSSIFIR